MIRMNNGIFTVGMVILILGILAFAYSVIIGTSPGGPIGQENLRYYAIPMIIVGLVVMVIGAIIPSITTTTEHVAARPAYTTYARTGRSTTTVSED